MIIHGLAIGITPGKNQKPNYFRRVRIKLWKQGIRADGVTYGPGGEIYPIIRGKVYIEWGQTMMGNRYISRMRGHPDDDRDRITEILEKGGIPDGITVLKYDEGGIDPYTFLNLRG